MLESYVTIVLYQHYDLDIVTIPGAYPEFTSYAYSHLCVSIVLGNFITRVALHNHHHNDDT